MAAGEIERKFDFEARKWCCWRKELKAERDTEFAAKLADPACVQEAVDLVSSPHTLLRFPEKGKPKSSDFRIAVGGDPAVDSESNDDGLTAIEWGSSSKKKKKKKGEKTRVALRSIANVMVGQMSPSFDRFRSKKEFAKYNKTSFTIVYRGEDEHLVNIDLATDSNEIFTSWIVALFHLLETEKFGIPESVKRKEEEKRRKAAAAAYLPRGSNTNARSMAKKWEQKAEDQKITRVSTFTLSPEVREALKHSSVLKKWTDFEEKSRKEYEAFKAMSKHEQATERVKRLAAIKEEIIESEKGYYGFLNTIIHRMMEPCEELVKKGKMQQKQLDNLFNNIKAIQPIHELISTALTSLNGSKSKAPSRKNSLSKSESDYEPSISRSRISSVSPETNTSKRGRFSFARRKSKAPKPMRKQTWSVADGYDDEPSLSRSQLAGSSPAQKKFFSFGRKKAQTMHMKRKSTWTPYDSQDRCLSMPVSTVPGSVPDEPSTMSDSSSHDDTDRENMLTSTSTTAPTIASASSSGSSLGASAGSSQTLPRSTPASPALVPRCSPASPMLGPQAGRQPTTMPPLARKSTAKPHVFKTIAAVLIHYAPVLRTYQPYISNFEEVQKTYDVLEHNSAFKKFLAEMDSDPDITLSGMMSYLIMPVQRLPRYGLLLRELKKYSIPKTKAYRELEEAEEKINAVTTEVNERKRAVESGARQLEISRQIGNKAFPDLIQPSRALLHEGAVKRLVGKHWKPIHAFIFNDIFMYATDKMKLIGAHKWADMRMDVNEGNGEGATPSVTLHSDGKGMHDTAVLNLTIRTDTESDLSEWRKHFDAQIQSVPTGFDFLRTM